MITPPHRPKFPSSYKEENFLKISHITPKTFRLQLLLFICSLLGDGNLLPSNLCTCSLLTTTAAVFTPGG